MAMSKFDAAARSADDCKSWVEGSLIRYHDLFCETGGIYECLDESGASCSVTRPSADTTGTIWATPTAAGLTAPPASKQIKLVKWKYSANVAAVNALSDAYEVGSIATTKDGGVYTCDPASASFGFQPFTVFSDSEIKDSANSVLGYR